MNISKLGITKGQHWHNSKWEFFIVVSFALRGMLNFLYEDPSDYWHGHVPYNCAVSIIEADNRTGKLIADDKIYYDLGNAVDQYVRF